MSGVTFAGGDGRGFFHAPILSKVLQINCNYNMIFMLHFCPSPNHLYLLVLPSICIFLPFLQISHPLIHGNQGTERRP